MPKVYLTEMDRICARFAAWVYGEMKLRKISQRALAKKRGISHQALSQKLQKRRFDFEDFVFFIKEFEPCDKSLRELSGL